MDGNEGGDSEVQRTMLELLNQLDGFEPTQNIKVIMEELKLSGIGSRPFFWPVHKQPVFNKKGLYINENYANSEFIAERGFYIPSGLTLTNNQIDYVSEVIRKIFS